VIAAVRIGATPPHSPPRYREMQSGAMYEFLFSYKSTQTLTGIPTSGVPRNWRGPLGAQEWAVRRTDRNQWEDGLVFLCTSVSPP
jgi:hypothetical protein